MYRASEHRSTQVVVDLEAIKHNIQFYRSEILDHQKVYAVVKADAYGHGAIAVAKAALQAGVEGLCVATVDEAISLRKAGIADAKILVLGLTSPLGIAEILLYDITVTVAGLDFFELAYQQLVHSNQESLLDDYSLKIHLKLDTGMSRIGLRKVSEVEAFTAGVSDYPWVDWQGVFTHFATAGSGSAEYIDFQWHNWEQLMQVIPDTVKIKHFDNSIMGLHEKIGKHSDIVRLGIGQYGIDGRDLIPEHLVTDQQLAEYRLNKSQLKMSSEAQLSKLKPAFQLMSELSYVKKVEKGTCISYGASYQSLEDEWIGTIPIGYADGWLRAYNKVPILINGYPCPVVGVINMDQLMVRLPQPFPVGTEVTLIGRDGNNYNHPSLVAYLAGTISYEIFTTIGDRVPRVYI